MDATQPVIARLLAWARDLREAGPPRDTGLSPAGAAEAWSAALAALEPAVLVALAQRGGPSWGKVALVVARGAFTAPIEWCAALLASGAEVGLKPPTGARGACRRILAAAKTHGLPVTEIGNAEVLTADLAVVMGSDETVATVQRQRTGPTLGFGHRFSAAWLTGAALPDDPSLPDGWRSGPFAGLAADLALYDTAGCLSPALVLTPRPLPEMAESLAPWMAAAQRAWPRGEISDAAQAEIRARRALARATTGVVIDGEDWCILGLPVEHALPAALPRMAVLCGGDLGALAAWHGWLSTVGTDSPIAGVPPGVRTCRLGRMQRPAMDRLHDGVDWLSWTRPPPPVR